MKHRNLSKYISLYIIAGLLVSSAFICTPAFAGEDDLEKSMEEVKLKSAHLLKQLEGLKKSTQNDPESYDDNSDVQNTKVGSEQMVELLRPYQEMEISQIIDTISGSITNPKLKEVSDKYPVVITYFAHLLKDEQALPSLLRLSEDRETMKVAGLFLIGTFFFAFILRRILSSKGLGFFSRVRRWFFQFFLLWAIRIGIIYHFYGEALAPSARIFKDVVLRPYLIT